MDARIGTLALSNVLDLNDDDLQHVARAAHANGDLVAFATTCQRLCLLSRSRVPVTWRLKSYKSLSGFAQQVAGGGLPFTSCERLTAVAPQGTNAHALTKALRAATSLSRLSTLELHITPNNLGAQDSGRSRKHGYSSCDAEEALYPLSRLQQLRQLQLNTIKLGTEAAKHLATLTAVTSLLLMQDSDWGFGCPIPPDLSPLSSMSRLVEMAVDGEGVPAPPAAAGPYALPSSLRRLSLKGDIAYWLAHLAGCPHLEQLQLNYEGTHQHASAHPAAVLKLVARQTPCLRRLTCAFTKGATFTKQLPLLHGTTVEREAWLPCRPLAACTALQHLDVGRYLRVRDKAHWEALGALPALTTLQGILVEGAPPPGWRHGGVQQLGVVVRLPGHEAAATAVLLAFPAAQVVDLRGVAGGHTGLYQLPPVSGMGSLEELLVDATTAPPAAAAGPFSLPPTLHRLHLEGEAAAWLQHLPGCPGLKELQYQYQDEQHASAHPAAVLELAARHTRGLRSLTCYRPTSSSSGGGGGGATSSDDGGSSSDSGGSSSSNGDDGSGDGGSSSSDDDGRSSSGTLDQQQGEMQHLPPTEEQQQLPPSMTLAALTSLRHLCAGQYLCVRSAADWQALGQLSALSSLRGIVVYQAPPQGWRHQQVSHVEVVLEGVSGQGAAQVLAAFPAVQQAQVTVRGVSSEQLLGGGVPVDSRVERGVPLVLSSLTSLQLEYPEGQYAGPASPAVHAAPMLAAARGVSELSFDGECAQQGGGVQLPDLSGVTGVTRLRFGRSQVMDQAARAAAVVAMVQPLAPTLRVLELSRVKGLSPEAAVALQQVLPRMKHVMFAGCGRIGIFPLSDLQHIKLRASLVLTVSS